MTDVDSQWCLSNPGPNAMLVWLEPWAEEFEVQARSTISMKPSGGSLQEPLGEVDWNADHLVIWASARTVEVFIDGELQRSGSAIIPIPDGLNKKMLNILFAKQPAARLGVIAPNATRTSTWWQRVKRRFGV